MLVARRFLIKVQCFLSEARQLVENMTITPMMLLGTLVNT